MLTYNVARARQAVQYLVDTPFFERNVKRLRGLLTRPRSMPYTGESECLNELLVIGRQSLESFERLVELAKYKRDDRDSYQRRFMAAKRQRDRKAILLESLLTGRHLSLDERRAVLLKQYTVWNKERTAALEAHKELSWQARNALIKDFWETKEAEIDALIEEARKPQKLVRRKQVVVVEREPTTEFGAKLKQVIGPAKKPRNVRVIHVDKGRR